MSFQRWSSTLFQIPFASWLNTCRSLRALLLYICLFFIFILVKAYLYIARHLFVLSSAKKRDKSTNKRLTYKRTLSLCRSFYSLMYMGAFLHTCLNMTTEEGHSDVSVSKELYRWLTHMAAPGFQGKESALFMEERNVVPSVCFGIHMVAGLELQGDGVTNHPPFCHFVLAINIQKIELWLSVEYATTSALID